MKKINVAQLLKDCPSGMELDCTMYDNCTFAGIEDVGYIDILIRTPSGIIRLTKEGCYIRHDDYAKCVIFPKGKTTWEGFQRPFVDGDIVCYLDSIAIFKEWGDETLFRTYVTAYLHGDSTIDVAIPLFGKSIRKEARLATEEEKAKLFQAIKDNGYNWNSETKTLEKLIEPKFKVWDRIVDILRKHVGAAGAQGVISEITDDKYIFTDGSYMPISSQENWELVPNKFNIDTLVPFESRVLVRSDINRYWIPAFWGFKHNGVYNTTRGWDSQCIPYEGNEHLLGTTKDCNEYFKTWE